MIWYYREALSARKTIFEKRKTNRSHSFKQEIAVTYETDTKTYPMSYYSRTDGDNVGEDYDSGRSYHHNTNAWNQVAIKMTSGKTSTARNGWYSSNGAAFINEYYSRTSNATIPAGNISVGDGYAGTVDAGAIAEVLVYNRPVKRRRSLAQLQRTKGTVRDHRVVRGMAGFHHCLLRGLGVRVRVRIGTKVRCWSVQRCEHYQRRVSRRGQKGLLCAKVPHRDGSRAGLPPLCFK